MSWLQKLLPSRIRTAASEKKGVPEGLWIKCHDCGAILYHAELVRHLKVCPSCGFHHRLNARERLEMFLDEGNTHEIAPEIETVDRLKFKDSKRYKDRIIQAQKSTGEKEALIVMKGSVGSVPVVACAFEFGFMGGSMGAAVGEKIIRALMVATEANCACVCFTASGGARMQEGLFSLMQMAKTSAALARFAEKKLPFIVVLTDPTMGGVSASFASLGDIIIAEPKALIGFAGPRVIEQTVRQTLPDGFQRAEFLLEHGHIDMVLPRSELKNQISEIIAKLTHQQPRDKNHEEF